MTDDRETLLSLEETEAKEAEGTQTGFTLAIVERELVLICSLVLRYPQAFLIEGDDYVHPETTNDHYYRLWRDFFSHSNARNRSYLQGLPPRYTGEELLPDVCGKCFRTIGFCNSGRIRSYCRDCYDKAETLPNGLHSFKRLFYPARICYDSLLRDAIFAQLIHKYYSPNGDKSWKMKSLIS